MPRVTYFPIFTDRPMNPARTNILTGDTEINKWRMKQLADHTQEYVWNHEEGHYKEHTFSEVAADEYALRKMALKKPYSLIHYLESVKEVSYNNPERVRAAQYNVLKIAAEKGNSKAQELLDRHYPMAAADGSQNSRKCTKYLVVAACIVAAILIIKYVKKNG